VEQIINMRHELVRLAKGIEINLRLHRSGASAYIKALGSLLGRMLPAAASKAKH
jgi:hypothetical protein